MTRTARLLFAFLATLPVSIQAAPKPAPAPKPFVPEVAYRYVGSAGMDLRLASATGDAAILLHRSRYMGAFDLAPRSVQAAALSEATGTGTERLVLRAWAQAPNNGAITVAPGRTLHEGINIYYPDFSPDGAKIAFIEYQGGHGADASYSLQTVEVSSGSLQTIASGLREPYYPVWSHTGDAIYYASLQPVNGVNNYVATRHPVDGSAVTEMFQKPRIGRWDILRDRTDRLIMTTADSASSQALAFAIWDGSTLTPFAPQLTGTSPHFACGNSKMIYISYTGGGVRGPLKVFTPSTGSDVVYSKDKNANDADWIPCG